MGLFLRCINPLGDKHDLRACGTLGSYVVIGAPVAVDRCPTVFGQLEFVYQLLQKKSVLSGAQLVPRR